MKLLDKYIAKEITSPFVVSLVAVSTLMLIGRMVRFFDLIIAKGVSVKQVMFLFVYMTPFILALSIPISVLISVVLAFNRLSTDSEIIAMKSIGINLTKLSRIPFWLGACAYVVTSFISFYLLPDANLALKNEFFNIIIRKTTVGINEKAFNTFTNDIIFYVDKLSQNRELMNHVIIYDARDPKLPNTIIAEQGKFVVNRLAKTITLSLKNGSIQQLADNPDTIRIINFKHYDISFSEDEISPSMSYYNKSTFEMTIPELIGEYYRLKKDKKQSNSLLTDIAERFAIPFTTFIFAIIGIPLGIKSPRSGKAYGITIAVIIVLFYYIILSGAETVGKLNILNPVIAVALVDLFFLISALILYYLVSLEKSLQFFNPFSYLKRYK
jgi:LPS export ABC transporter permease LptF